MRFKCFTIEEECMKKKILFVMENLRIGGAEKSLVTLLSHLDYDKYEVDLFLFRKQGDFIELLPDQVNILEAPRDFQDYILNPRKSIKCLLKRKKIKLLLYKSVEILNIIFYRYIFNKEYIGWSFIKKNSTTIESEYEVAVGFLEKKSIYFVIDRVNAKRKIGWIHTDYSKIDFNSKLDNKYYSQLDKIVTVSDSCKKAFLNIFPSLKSKTTIIENFISPKLIWELATDSSFNLLSPTNGISIVTVARLTKAKNLEIIIDVMKVLTKYYHIKWYIIGEGELKETLQNKININGLGDNIILTGGTINPYVYMHQADIYVQTSIWEGFGITVAEAKSLYKPIIVSAIPEFANQIKNYNTGLIYKDKTDLVTKIEQLIKDNDLKQKLISNLQLEQSNEIPQLTLIDNLLT